MPVIDALRTGAQVVLPAAGPLRGAPAEEVGLLHRWLATGGTRLVHAEPAVDRARPQRRGVGGRGRARAPGRPRRRLESWTSPRRPSGGPR